jgi:hypothetical protein
LFGQKGARFQEQLKRCHPAWSNTYASVRRNRPLLNSGRGHFLRHAASPAHR